MKDNLKLVSLLSSLLLFCWDAQTQSLDELVKFMTGSFNSASQAKIDSNYYDVSLEMVPIWKKDKSAKWFYVEQALSARKEKPYRQRIYKVTQTGYNTFESAVYLLPKEEKFIGAYSGTSKVFRKLKQKKITEKEGCTIKLIYNGNYYYGKTDDKTCPSKLRGARYATSEVKIFEDRLESWDRGFDENGEHVWGATNGAYIFYKKFKSNLKTMEYPNSKQNNIVDDYFGTKVKDPYRWLEEDKSLETKNWVVQQNELTDNYLSQFNVRNKIKTRLTEVANHDKSSMPKIKAGNAFIFKKQGLESQHSVYIKEKGKTDFTLLIDSKKLSSDGTVSLTNVYPSRDGKYLIYGLRTGGSDWLQYKLMDLSNFKVLEDEINRVKFSEISWYKNGYFYSKYKKPTKSELSDRNRFEGIFYHKVGTKQSEDILIFEDRKNSDIGYSMKVSEDEQHFFINAWKGTSGSNLYYKKAGFDKIPFQLILDDWRYDYYLKDVKNNVAYIQTNKDASNWKVMRFDLTNNKILNDFIPEKEFPLEFFKASKDNYVISYQKDVLSKLFVLDKNGKEIKQIELPDQGTLLGISADKNSNECYYKFESYLNPAQTVKYNLTTDENSVFHRTNVDFKSEDYQSEQKFYTSKDGTKIPIIITYKKGLDLNGDNPTLLSAYGGFNISIQPSFTTTKIPFLEQGGILAVANIRGGGEYGEEWHKAGMLDKKQNVFDDFIAAAEYLIDEKFTSPSKLAITGRSNGGLLIGAVVNQRPDLFKVAIPAVGVMDMLRFQHFTIGYAWVVEYGSSENTKDFKNLYAYSPIHNIKPNKYPATLVITADRDDRVVPAHSFKYIATLQQNQIGDEPVLIRIDTNSGHGSGKSTEQVINEYLDIWTFIFHHLGMNYSS